MSAPAVETVSDLHPSEVRQAEEARRVAMLAGDIGALRELLADDVVWVHASAGQDTKASFIEGFASGRLKCFRLDHADTQVRLHGHAAIVTGQVEMDVKLTGHRRVAANVFVAVWVRTTTGVQLSYWQSTRLPASVPGG